MSGPVAAAPVRPAAPAAAGAVAPAPDQAALAQRRRRKLALKVVVSATLLALLVRMVSWATIRRALSDIPPFTFALVVAGFLASHVVGTLKWRMVLGVAGAKLRVREALECYAAGIFSNIFLPSIVGGDVLRAVLAGRRSGRMEAAVLGGAADRVLDIASLGILAVGGGLFVGFRQPEVVRTLVFLAAGVGAVALVAMVPLLVRRPLSKWPPKLRRRVALVLIALRRQRRQPLRVLAAFAGACAIQAALTLLNMPIGHALGIEAPFSAWFFAWSLSKIASLLPVSLNGLGVRDAAFVFFFVPLMTNANLGTDEMKARAVASSLSWQATLLVSSLLAGAAWSLLKRLNGPLRERAPRG